jgi:hypothetical protein
MVVPRKFDILDIKYFSALPRGSQRNYVRRMAQTGGYKNKRIPSEAEIKAYLKKGRTPEPAPVAVKEAIVRTLPSYTHPKGKIRIKIRSRKQI